MQIEILKLKVETHVADFTDEMQKKLAEIKSREETVEDQQAALKYELQKHRTSINRNTNWLSIANKFAMRTYLTN